MTALADPPIPLASAWEAFNLRFPDAPITDDALALLEWLAASPRGVILTVGPWPEGGSGQRWVSQLVWQPKSLLRLRDPALGETAWEAVVRAAADVEPCQPGLFQWRDAEGQVMPGLRG